MDQEPRAAAAAAAVYTAIRMIIPDLGELPGADARWDEIGADSVDRVEIAQAAAHELGNPRMGLDAPDLNTVGALIDVLAEASTVGDPSAR
jgi:hypothetical protein